MIAPLISRRVSLCRAANTPPVSGLIRLAAYRHHPSRQPRDLPLAYYPPPGHTSRQYISLVASSIIRMTYRSTMLLALAFPYHPPSIIEAGRGA
jgi:hypothetical protein